MDNASLIIFSDLDGTFLNAEDYSYAPAVPVLTHLLGQCIPIIPVTSKTRQEVLTLRQALGWSDPFIVENGSGVFIPSGDRRFTDLDGTPSSEPWQDYRLIRLGCTYAEARQGLRAIARALGEDLRGFGDLSADEIAQRTGLALDAVQQAQTRDFTEPFVTPHHISSDRLKQVVQAHGFRVVVGDRFSHLIGAGSGKGKAVKQLVQLYQATLGPTKLVTVGLGNSPNDLDMLEAVDIPVVVPGKKGPHPGLADRGWRIAPAAGSEGWAQAVQDIYHSFEEPSKR